MFLLYNSEGRRPLPMLISHWMRVAPGNGHNFRGGSCFGQGSFRGGEDWAVCQQASELSLKYTYRT